MEPNIVAEVVKPENAFTTLNAVLQVIGTIASISSIPLAIYFFFKQSKNQLIDVKNQIVKKISQIVADGNEVKSIDVIAVIKSTLRDNNLKDDKILATNIVEDMISEVISNPLLDPERKVDINNNLRIVLSELQVVTYYSLLKDDQKENYLNNIVTETNNPDKNNEIKQLSEENILNEKEYKIKKTISSIMSTSLVVITGIVTTFIASVLTFDKEIISAKFDDNIIVGVLVLSAVSIIAMVGSIINKTKK